MYDVFLTFSDMDATDINWEPILEMLPTQEMKEYDERMKYKKIMVFQGYNIFSGKCLTCLMSMTRRG